MKYVRSLSLLMVFVFGWSGILSAQGTDPQLFEKVSITVSEWNAKQISDLNYSPIQFNPSVLSGVRHKSMERISVTGPDDQTYAVTINRIINYKNGDWSATGMINNEWKNSFTLSYSSASDKILASANVVTAHTYFELRYSQFQNSHILVEKDPHQTDKLSCGHDDPLTIDEENIQSNEEYSQPGTSNDHGPSTIDVLIVYTQSAENWAISRGGIDNVINQAMALAQLSADNSLLDIEFKLVHRQLIEYDESGNSITDLERLTASPTFNPWGQQSAGYMDEVHQMRDDYGADLVSLFSSTNDVGGIAWVINIEAGLPQYGFSITRVQQAANTSTHAHEMGHNFGNAHSRNQNSNTAGPTGGIFPYSTGWRWTGNNGFGYVSVMTYQEGDQQVEIFSNPDVLHEGVPTGSYEGDFAPADNARSMSEMQHAIANYRTAITDVEPAAITTSPVQDVSYSRARIGGFITNTGGGNVSEKGICWGRNQNPGLEDDCIKRGSGTGSFQTLITNLHQGTDYYARAYAINQAGTAYGNQQMFSTLPLNAPDLLSASDQNAVSFTAQWSKVHDAGHFFLDVSRSPVFSSYITGYENVNVGNVNEYPITNLEPGIDYYFRVRSGAETTYSDHSTTGLVTTVDVSAKNSGITVSRDKVLATGVQESLINVLINNSKGEPLDEVEVMLEAKKGNSTISPSSAFTDASGTAMFSITNDTEENIHYNVFASGLKISEETDVEIEFLFSEGVLTLGNNYPNPYNNQTLIPIVIPQRTRVKMDVVNIMGAVVQTVVDEEFNVGYYEVPFNGSGLASGVYFYRLITKQGIRVEKMLLAK